MIGLIRAFLRRGTVALLSGMILLGLGALPARAQISLGIKGGVHRSNMKVTENGAAPAIPYESVTGLVAGVSAALDVTPWMAVQVEGRYTRHGSQQHEGGLAAAIQLSQVEVPLVARVFVLGAEAPVRPRLHAGGVVRFETGCNVHVTGTATLDLDCDAAGLEGHKTTDYGVLFGGGADIRLGPGAVTLDAEYALGLRQIAGDPTVEAFSRVWGVMAGYRFAL